MVKNNIGGSKSKNISSKVTKKKIVAEEPDFENSFFAVVVTKPNGLMCTVKLCENEKLKKIMDETGLKEEIQVNIGKLKHDKRNNSLGSGDIVQVEFTFDMKRGNGSYYGCILCKYDVTEIKYFKRQKLLILDDETSYDDNLDKISEEESKNKSIQIEYPEVSSDIDLDDL